MVSKPRHKPTTAKGASVAPSEANPESWLYLNPAGPNASGLVFGVLRKVYAGRQNSALEFGWRKAHVGCAADGGDIFAWSPNVERVEVLLPSGADDALADPATLLGRMDESAIDREKALLVYLTLPLADVDRIHIGWERARSFVRDCIAREHGLAAMLALHAPGRVGLTNPLHAHALVVPRCAAGLGIAHGAYADELIRDSGQALVEEMWTKHVKAFR